MELSWPFIPHTRPLMKKGNASVRSILVSALLIFALITGTVLDLMMKLIYID